MDGHRKFDEIEHLSGREILEHMRVGQVGCGPNRLYNHLVTLFRRHTLIGYDVNIIRPFSHGVTYAPRAIRLYTGIVDGIRTEEDVAQDVRILLEYGCESLLPDMVRSDLEEFQLAKHAATRLRRDDLVRAWTDAEGLLLDLYTHLVACALEFGGISRRDCTVEDDHCDEGVFTRQELRRPVAAAERAYKARSLPKVQRPSYLRLVKGGGT